MTSSSHSEPARLRVDLIDNLDNGDAARIVIRGEADISNADKLDVALSRIALDGASSVQLQVADLAFLDVAALRRLTAFAVRMKQEGRTVETSGAGPALLRMATELAVHDELGLPRHDPPNP